MEGEAPAEPKKSLASRQRYEGDSEGSEGRATANGASASNGSNACMCES